MTTDLTVYQFKGELKKMERCKQCGGQLVTWAIDANGDRITRCNTVLTSRGIDGSHGFFNECRQYYRNGDNITGGWVQIVRDGKYVTVNCDS